MCNVKLFSTVGLTVALAACGGGGDSSSPTTSESQYNTSVAPSFASVFTQEVHTLEQKSEVQVMVANRALSGEAKIYQQDQRFTGSLKVTHLQDGKVENLDWTVTLRANGDVESHGAIALPPGTYDFVMLLERSGRQYVAQSLAQEVKADNNSTIDLTLLPNLGESISDIDQVEYISKVQLNYPSSDLMNFQEPKFGISINKSDELIFDINKEMGTAEVVLNVEEGTHQLSLNFYEGNLMVGQNKDQTTINLSEGEDVKVDIVPLQADVKFQLDRLNDSGMFTFNIPKVIVDEVGGINQLSVLARFNIGSHQVQEKVLNVEELDGAFFTSDVFNTYGEEKVSVYLAFYPSSQMGQGFEEAPFTSCSTTVNVETRQVLGCKVELKRSSVVSGRLLSTLMLNVREPNGVPAKGAEVYLNNNLIGLTGDQYQEGSLKTYIIAGEHDLKVIHNLQNYQSSMTIAPLTVVNKPVNLEQTPVSAATFEDSAQELATQDWSSFTAGDFNNDGFVDFFDGKCNSTNTLWNNDGTGKLTPKNNVIGPNFKCSYTSAVGDFTGDGLIDLVVSTSRSEPENKHGTELRKNLGNGEFERMGWFGVDLYDISANDIVVADFSGNGHLDVLLNGSFNTYLFVNDGSSQFERSPERHWNGDGDKRICPSLNESGRAAAFAQDITYADFNKDGHLDFAVACGAILSSETDSAHASTVWFGTGTGDFTMSQQAIGNSYSIDVIAEDFNNDGYTDLFYRTRTGGEIWLNDKSGVFYASGYPLGIGESAGVSVADINRDGYLDLIVSVHTERSTHGAILKNDNTIHYNNGSGDFTVFQDLISHTRSKGVRVVDLNNDGKLDLLEMGWGSNRSKVLINTSE